MAKYPLFLLVTGIILSSMVAIPISASQLSSSKIIKNTDLQANSPVAEHTCISLVQDSSGSMKGNDPDFMRNTGAKLFITMLDDGDQIGIVRFSTSSTKVTAELVTLTSPQDKYKVIDLLQDIPPDGYTDIRAALRDAIDLLSHASCEQRYIVLLSDGQPELPGGIPKDYTSSTIDLVSKAGIPVLGIALTPEGESGLLYRLAASTSPAGKVIPARTASDLMDAYLEALAQLEDRTVVGSGFSSSPGFSSLPLDPGLAQYITRVTYIISKPKEITAQMVAPGNENIRTNDPHLVFTYTADPRFAAFTIDSPAPGTWGFRLSGAGQVQVRAILRSRLRINIHQPALYQPQGEPLPVAVSLIEENPDGHLTNLIGDVTFSVLFIRPDGSQDEIDQLYDSGTHGDLTANDGIFANEYVKTDIPGEYQMIVSGHKGLIPVTRSYKFVVVPFPKIIPINPSESLFRFRGQPLILTMKLDGGEPPILDAGKFVARITDANGSSKDIPLIKSDNQSLNYSGQYIPDSEGHFTIDYLPLDATYKGVPYQLFARRELDILIIPTVEVAESSIDLGVVETSVLSNGLTVKLNLTSSSMTGETVNFEVVGLPGLSIAVVTPQKILTGPNQVFLTLKGDLPVNKYQAGFQLTTREGVDLTRQVIPFTLTVYQPTLLVSPDSIDLGRIRVDKIGQGQEIILNITSSSLKDEPFTLKWAGTENIHLQTEVTSLTAGKQNQVLVRIKEDNVKEKVITGQIVISSRKEVQVMPNTIQFKLAILPVPFLTRWGVPIGGTGILLVTALLVMGSVVGSRDHIKGVLKPINVPGKESLPGEILLSSAGSFLHPDQALIGSWPGSLIRLSGSNVRPRHAVIKSVQMKMVERIGKPLRSVEIERRVNIVRNLGDGLVKVNSVTLAKGQQSAPLRTGMKIRFGDYEFEYRD